MDLSALIFAALKSAKTANERIDALPLPMVFKGSLGTGGTISTLPTASSENEGYVYIVITDGTYAGQSAKAGDTFVSDGSAWVLVPSADEPPLTVKTFSYTGTGTNSRTITLPDIPSLILEVTGQTAETQIITAPPFDSSDGYKCGIIVTTSTYGALPFAFELTTSGNRLTFASNSSAKAFNATGIEFTVYYI